MVYRLETREKGNTFSLSLFFFGGKLIDNIYVVHGSVNRTDSLDVTDGVITEVRSHTIVRETEEIKIWKGNWRIRGVSNGSDKPSMPSHHSTMAKEYLRRGLWKSVVLQLVVWSWSWGLWVSRATSRKKGRRL